ncbi:MAG: carbamoyl-phosphate synthase (glutamine-hydrolyzing) small subunit, partial [Bacteroidota bacterium]
MLGKIVMHDPEETGFYDPNLENLVALVSTREKMIYPGGETRIMVVDCGVKNNIIRCLLDLGATVIRVPWDYDFSGDDYDGLVVSNGPGDPRQCLSTIGHLQQAIAQSGGKTLEFRV